MPTANMPDMKIRAPRPDERDALVGIWERSVRATHHFLQEHDIVTLRPLVGQELDSDAVEWWVLASSTDAPIGFLGLTGNAIEGLFIDPEHRGQGGGSFLVAYAQDLRPGTLTVDVNEQNDAARGFYESLGFSVIGRSATDDAGRPFPRLHLERRSSAALKARTPILETS
ncbi:MAG TPA: acetyltransferase [Gemmatimonadaceae bacterium]|nr:acetyltransferase [Gemmatimonadaceae bacterium]